MNLIVNKAKGSFNENYAYTIYELLKVKGSWFENNHENIMNLFNTVMEQELTVKVRMVVGKTLGLMIKKNYKVVDFVLDMKKRIGGDDYQI